MTNPYLKFGEAVVKTDGDPLDMTDVEYELDGKVYTKIDNGQGCTGRTEGGSLTGKIHLTPGMSVRDLRNLKDFTLIWVTDTGQMMTAAHAWIEGKPKVVSGGFSVEFGFKKCTEVVSNV